ncbi:30S ribosomal protein S13 [Candidatus Peregrinibacteria bacterium]|nr:30S ribosomal protein S13 [Candidatus Peregrinibacteria bacterium]
MRVAGINLPKGKRIEAALTYVYGIGRSRSRQILDQLKIDKNKRVEAITDEEGDRIRETVSKWILEGDLRRKIATDIKRLQEIGSYRGYRHRRRLPARGQRTRTNARTKRGKRVTVGSGRVKESKT